MSVNNYTITRPEGMPSPSTYSLTALEARKIINTAVRQIKKDNSNITVKLSSKTDNGLTETLPNGKSTITLGVKSLLNNTKDGRVSDRNLAFCIKNLFHEEQHHKDATLGLRKDALNPQEQRTLLDSKLRIAFPEYYWSHYYDIPYEINAEIQGISNACKFVKQHNELFKQMDFEKSFVEHTNKRQGWYGDLPVKSIKDALIKLQQKHELMSDAKLLPAIPNLSDIRCDEESWLPDLSRNPKYKNRLDNAKTLFEQQCVLIDYVNYREPNLLRSLPNMLPQNYSQHGSLHRQTTQQLLSRAYDRTVILPDSLKKQPDTAQTDTPDYL